MRASAARLCVAADHDFRPHDRFDLQPVAGALRHVLAVRALRDHAFEMKVFNLAKESLALSFDILREFDERRWPENLSQLCLALNHCARGEIITVNIKQIENEIEDLSLAAESFETALAAD